VFYDFLIYSLVVTLDIETPTYDHCLEVESELNSVVADWKDDKSVWKDEKCAL
jgi:hypothetical protein